MDNPLQGIGGYQRIGDENIKTGSADPVLYFILVCTTEF